MSYIENRITINQYIESITNSSKKNHIGSILNIFNTFCMEKYGKTNQQILDDIYDEVKKSHSNDKIYVFFNYFKDWLLVDHPDIVWFCGKNKCQKRAIKARHPHTVHTYMIIIRSIFEEIGNIEINSRLFNKRVKIPKAEEENPEQFTKNQMRLLLDSVSNQYKLKYMVKKDTGCRIGELVQIRKKDIDTTKHPIEIKIQARYTKTKKSRTVFVTRETTPMLLRLLNKKNEDDLVFGTNENPYIATATEKTNFANYRNKLANDYPEFGEIYQSNGRHKKTIHSIRSFRASQCTEAIDESWGHEYIGHKKYLGQYIRNQDKQVEKFLRSENYLMVYEHVEIVESDHRVEKLEQENQDIKKAMSELSKIYESLALFKEEKIKQEIEIEMLFSVFSSIKKICMTKPSCFCTL